MKILVIDNGLALDTVRRLSKEGNSVTYCNAIEGSHGEGLLDDWKVKKSDFDLSHDDFDIILYTDSGWGNDIDSLREEGKPVLGAGSIAETLETDRFLVKKICNDYGLVAPNIWKMDTVEAVDFIKSEKRSFVAKFSSLEKLPSYVPISVSDCIWYMEKIAAEKKIDVYLEDVVEGVDVSVSGFFNGIKFVEPFLVSFDHNKLMDGEVGPNTKMGVLLFYTSQDLSLVQNLKRLEPYFSGISHKGMVKLSCIVKDDDYSVIDIVCRSGYPTMTTQAVLHEDDLSDILYGVVKGNIDSFVASEDTWAVGVGLNTAGYPWDKIIQKQGCVRIYGLDDALASDCKLSFNALTKRYDDYYSCLGCGRVLVMNGVGKTIKAARDDAYRALDFVKFADMQFRLDIGLKVERRFGQLRELGVIPKNMRC